jgi:hypothetical protein
MTLQVNQYQCKIGFSSEKRTMYRMSSSVLQLMVGVNHSIQQADVIEGQ